ncbi:hypothetical protein EDEG_01156 [Edhazardia aedis USNM 41457]|uniref:Uncharacterized protein n=1 Tax=Edhazardia aedis (strain USNM 41457) TaxID=1003232 RepID=J9DAW4_EDHAE|nr:hypothetical protein EDEG_01156 [Edhazardia aedis USNM 41457]|eukprot:EJW04629.1 hypothetical protein EDEG_01156 [Edhazardia aedis USNM 41457]
MKLNFFMCIIMYSSSIKNSNLSLSCDNIDTFRIIVERMKIFMSNISLNPKLCSERNFLLLLTVKKLTNNIALFKFIDEMSKIFNNEYFKAEQILMNDYQAVSTFKKLEEIKKKIETTKNMCLEKFKDFFVEKINLCDLDKFFSEEIGSLLIFLIKHGKIFLSAKKRKIKEITKKIEDDEERINICRLTNNIFRDISDNAKKETLKTGNNDLFYIFLTLNLTDAIKKLEEKVDESYIDASSPQNEPKLFLILQELIYLKNQIRKSISSTEALNIFYLKKRFCKAKCQIL